MKNIIFILTTVVFTACGVSRPPSQYASYSSVATQDERIKRSLFNADDRTISEEDIQRLLDGNIKLPDSARVAIYNFGTNSLNKYYSSYNYNEEYLKLKQNYIETLISAVKESNSINKTILMPSILTNQNPTLTNLRESAVRLQADMLIIFSITSDIYYKYKAFKKDQAKAFDTIETVLLDIRTGVVPYSDIVTKEQLIKKEATDFNIRETQKRAENEAVISALSASGTKLVEFLNQHRR